MVAGTQAFLGEEHRRLLTLSKGIAAQHCHDGGQHSDDEEGHAHIHTRACLEQ